MKTFIKNHWIKILLLVFILLAILSINRCSTWKKRFNSINKNNITNCDSSKFKQKINKLEKTVATQEQQIVSKESVIKEKQEKISNLKDLKNSVSYKTKTIYKSDTIKDIDTVYKFNNSNYINVPMSFGENKQFYSYGFTIDSTGNVVRDSLSFSTKISLYWGREDHGWFKNLYKTNKPVVRIVSENPNLNFKSVTNKKFKDFREDNFSFSIQTGYGLTANGLSPYIGIGLDYELFSFKL